MRKKRNAGKAGKVNELHAVAALVDVVIVIHSRVISLKSKTTIALQV